MPDDASHENRISALSALVDSFADERDWAKFHSPKNLAMAIAIEAAELMEIFQWADTAESAHLVTAKRAAIEEEVADVFAYLLRFCSLAGIDLPGALRAKVAVNAGKYPADKVRGKSAKYNEY